MLPLFSACLFFSPPVVVMMMLSPTFKKRRVNRRNSPDQPQVPVGVHGILALIDHAQSPFATVVLDAIWPNNPPGQNSSWRQRIEEVVTYWRDNVQNVRPAAAILQHECLCSKNAFFRAEKAFKTGLMSQLVCICVFGANAVFSKNTKSGGLLKQFEGETFCDEVMVPLVTHLANYYNCVNKDGEDILTVQEVLDENFGNWRKNLIARVKSCGVFSSGEVIAMIDRETLANPADPNFDDTCCKGFYFPWHILTSIHHMDFHHEMKKAKPSHFITAAEATPNAWTIALATPPFE